MILYKSMSEIDTMRKSGHIVALVLDHLSSIVRPGITTWDLEEAALDFLKATEPSAIPAFKGYMGYPTSLCVSINDEVVHGIPSKKRIIKEGDVVSIDFGVFYNGYAGDAATTIIAGKGTPEAENLLKITRESLYEGIKHAKVGNYLHDISAAIQEYVEDHGYSVVRELVGHGIGQSMHEAPQVPNFGEKGTGIIIRPGLTIAVEPMVTTGNYDVVFLNDGWTAVTTDGSLAAHFEHSLAITSQGTFILTEL
ncbi:MAG: type I methionyl aminopeptidase [Proteobacteria bacterium]|nr:type I methionyl aminopeptidase [Pseudomonadota bacterium]